MGQMMWAGWLRRLGWNRSTTRGRTIEVDAARIDLVYPRRDVAVVVVCGEVDLAVQDELAKLVLDAVQAEATSEVVVDLAQTTFMGSAGIHALISGREAASHAGVKYHVRGASGIVRQVLAISGVLEILESPDGGA